MTDVGTFTDDDHNNFNVALEKLLEAVKTSSISPIDARGYIMQIIAAVDMGNSGEYRAWIQPNGNIDAKLKNIKNGKFG